MKASFYSRTPNTEVYNVAGRPQLPSYSLGDVQFKMMAEVVNSATGLKFSTPLFSMRLIKTGS